MIHKFPCPSCGQRVSVNEEQIGTECLCPACDQPIIVTVSEETFAPELLPLVEQVRALGFEYTPLAELNAEEVETESQRLQQFLRSFERVRTRLAAMSINGEIGREPNRVEMHAAAARLFALILADEWSDDAVATRNLLLETMPGIVR